jgi:hypothetical protein
MTYSEKLHPWCLIRLLPNCRRIVVARFRKRNDADAHLRVLQRLVKNRTFVIIFDTQEQPILPQQD